MIVWVSGWEIVGESERSKKYKGKGEREKESKSLGKEVTMWEQVSFVFNL